MSRIGKKPIPIPDGVKVSVQDRTVVIEGPKGRLTQELRPEVDVDITDGGKLLAVRRRDESRTARSLHGLTRALLQNMVLGVSQGFERRLEIVGVGYLAAVQGSVLQLRVGFANELQVPIPAGLTVACPDQQHVLIKGIDKQRVGQFAAEVRARRPAEPYNLKGIKYKDEVVRRKAGKTFVTGAT